jgi:Putative transposase/Transposase zinc-binding domain
VVSGLAQVLRRFGAAYLATHALNVTQARAWRAILACRTQALGGHRLQCERCGHAHLVFHSCRNRHCPQCQTRAKEAWAAARLSELLPVPYAHMVFTLPHALNPLASAHPRWVYDTLLSCTAQTLETFAANPRWLGARLSLTLVLHTWTQDLRRHLHVHALVSCGGLDECGKWVNPKRDPRFLFPVRALSSVFRAKFLDALDQARAQLVHDPQAAQWNQRRKALLKHDWVVYAKAPMGGPAQVLEYLSRYTHRTAISNERILGMDDLQVKLRVRADDKGGKRVIRIPGEQFVQRFMQHVLPQGFKRIRHYGLLGPAHKKELLTQARTALQAVVRLVQKAR